MEGNKNIASIYSLLTAQQHQACVPPAEIKQPHFNPLPYDTGFAQDGKLTISMDGRSIHWASSVVPVGAGTDQYMVSFYEGFSLGNSKPYTNVAGILCMNAQGQIDTAFGTRGDGIVPVRFASDNYTMPHSISVLPDALMVEGIHFWVVDRNFYQEHCVTRLHRDGTPDLAYGVEGVVNFQALFGAPFTITGSLVLPDGRMMVSGYNGLQGLHESYLMSLTSQGQLEPGFGDHGIMRLPVQIVPLPIVSGLELSEWDDKFFIYGTAEKLDRMDGFVGRFTMSGQLDTQFADNGYCYINTQPGRNVLMRGFSSGGQRLGLLASGEYYKSPRNSVIMRYTIDGASDPSFNNGWPVYMRFIENSNSNSWLGATFLPDGKIAAIGSCTLTNTDFYDIIGRFSGGGRLDTTFAGGAGFGSPLNAEFFPSGSRSLVAAGPGRWLYPGSFAGRGAVMAFSI